MTDPSQLLSALRSEGDLQLLRDSADNCAVYLLDVSGCVSTWSLGAALIFRRTRREMIGQHFRALFVKGDETPTRILDKAVREGSAHATVLAMSNDGRSYKSSFEASVLRDVDGRPTGYSVVTRDLSDRKAIGDSLQALQQDIRRQRDRLYAAAESSMDAFYICDAVRGESGEVEDFTFSYLNSNVEKMVHIPPEKLIGGKMCELLPVNRTLGLFDRYKQVVDSGKSVAWEFAVDDEDVRSSWIRVQVVKLEDGVAITASDISERKRHDAQLAEAAAFTQSIFASSPFATMVIDREGVITSVNPAAERMLWYRREELIGTETPLVLLDPKQLAKRAAVLSEELAQEVAPGLDVLTAKPQRGLVEEAEWQLIRRDGSRFDAQLTISSLTENGGNAIGYVIKAYDITERKRAQEYISHLAHHDALTGLPTRTLLHDRLSIALKHASRSGEKVSLLMVDLDYFKRVNDLMGHHCGDELLGIMAERLQGCVRASDTVARMGGDEFVVLLSGLARQEDAEFIVEKITTQLAIPACVGGQVFSPTASIGVCTYPDHGQTAETMLRNADLAMYQAKAGGRNGHRVFNQKLEQVAARNREVESNLNQALAKGEFELVYQPQISMKTGAVTGVEALIRWRSATLGTVMPNEFIPLAEGSGMIVPIGEWVLRTACKQGKQLQIRTGRALTVAVNVSPRQFQFSNLPKIVVEALADANLDPAALEIEITENILVGNSSKPVEMLEELRAAGVRVAIDDFGTGFSSMSYILRFRVDRLKIDQSFVREMTTCNNNYAVTAAVMAMARSLQIPVVAEGVETAAHRDLLALEGCDEGQGYYYSRAVSYDSLPAVIRAIEQSRFANGMIGDPTDLEMTTDGFRVN